LNSLPPEFARKSNAILSFKISHSLDNKKDGQVTFGAADPATFDAATAITLANVNTKGFWEADLGAVTFGSKDTGRQRRTAILDTGTTLVVAPLQDVQSVLSKVPGAKMDGQGRLLIPCTTSTQLALNFGGKSFAVNPRDFIFASADPNDVTGNYLPGLSARNIGGPNEWLVGDVFLKNAAASSDLD
jgi:hypothetical protein